eukprot:INCI11782.1.p1 GENE.INCI11782.1~~INCI11782.1.p1  ORF type:complete len:146 (+),score=40.47 INCI11782.1:216-653(+)
MSDLWTEHAAPEGGVFYFNAKKNCSTWTLPVGATVTRPVAPAAAAAAVDAASQVQSGPRGAVLGAGSGRRVPNAMSEQLKRMKAKRQQMKRQQEEAASAGSAAATATGASGGVDSSTSAYLQEVQRLRAAGREDGDSGGAKWYVR